LCDRILKNFLFMRILYIFSIWILLLIPSSASKLQPIDCPEYGTCESGCSSHPECGWCDNDRACMFLNQTCSGSLFLNGKCPVFFEWSLAIGTLLCFIGGVASAGSGIGGGAFYVPIFILVLRYSPHVAVPLSKVTILGVAIGGYIYLVRKRHPKADRPLIDYNIALLMEPLILAGTIIGVFANIAFPSYLIIVFLVVLLGLNSYRTYVKGFQLYKEEKNIKVEEKTNYVRYC